MAGLSRDPFQAPQGSTWTISPQEQVTIYLTRLKTLDPMLEPLLSTSLPEGYTLYEQPRPMGSHVDRYLYGHPSGKRFRSVVEFLPHIQFMAFRNTISQCTCKLCNFDGGRGDDGSSSRKATPIRSHDSLLKRRRKQTRAVLKVKKDLGFLSDGGGGDDDDVVSELTDLDDLGGWVSDGSVSSCEGKRVKREEDVKGEGMDSLFDRTADKLENVNENGHWQDRTPTAGKEKYVRMDLGLGGSNDDDDDDVSVLTDLSELERDEHRMRRVRRDLGLESDDDSVLTELDLDELDRDEKRLGRVRRDLEGEESDQESVLTELDLDELKRDERVGRVRRDLGGEESDTESVLTDLGDLELELDMEDISAQGFQDESRLRLLFSAGVSCRFRCCECGEAIQGVFILMAAGPPCHWKCVPEEILVAVAESRVELMGFNALPSVSQFVVYKSIVRSPMNNAVDQERLRPYNKQRAPSFLYNSIPHTADPEDEDFGLPVFPHELLFRNPICRSVKSRTKDIQKGKLFAQFGILGSGSSTSSKPVAPSAESLSARQLLHEDADDDMSDISSLSDLSSISDVEGGESMESEQSGFATAVKLNSCAPSAVFIACSDGRELVSEDNIKNCVIL
ncbi:UNVERIFIED_CONTAM: hypothetical protein HDU68_009111 [Siphonaria sp. JEL0065]|nr:hypothetical protein HDU68_009111 [Siphonaria sp. JEL0065]